VDGQFCRLTVSSSLGAPHAVFEAPSYGTLDVSASAPAHDAAGTRALRGSATEHPIDPQVRIAGSADTPRLRACVELRRHASNTTTCDSRAIRVR
jgi:hypothetical protein